MRSQQAEAAYKAAILRAINEGRVWAHMAGNDVSHLALRSVWATERYMKRWR
jgi:hypothetical protein